jgi:hypothetical protein
MTLELIRHLGFLALLLASSAYALAKGGRPERIAATTLLCGALMSLSAARPLQLRFHHLERGILAIDLVILGIFLWLSLRTTRFWPMWIAALLSAEVLIHIALLLVPGPYRLRTETEKQYGAGGANHPHHRDLAPSQSSGHAGERSALEGIIRLATRTAAPDIAHRLLHRFGTFGDLLAAHPRERRAILADYPEIEEALRALRLAMGHILEAKLAKRTVLSTDRAVLDYLRARMAFEPIEIFRILFLNAANGLLADEEIARGTVGAVCVHPREILRRRSSLALPRYFSSTITLG